MPEPVASPTRRRILMLSWEYPPLVVGGLGRHVHALATSLAATGHEVTVVTRHAPGAAVEEYREGVRIVRAPEDPPLFPLATPSLLAWTMAFNHSLTRAALHAAATGTYDVIHAHDWLVTHTAVTLRDHLGIPLVATIHATEAGRHQGWLPEEMNKAIHSVEWWLAHEAERVLVCSAYMRWEVTRLLELNPSIVEVIPNGVDGSAWQVGTPAVNAARVRFAGAGPLIGFAGRLVYEKGVQHLVGALPQLRRHFPGLRLVVAGDGPHRNELVSQAQALKLQRAVTFTGFLGNDLPALLAATDAVVVPSIYEPFGMVALEAAAAGAPLAVAATGGLAEIVEPGVTGVTFPAKDSDALAGAVGTLLGDARSAKRMARRALNMITDRYGWARIAALTASAYDRAVSRGPAAQAAAAAARLTGERVRIVVPDGNLLTGGDSGTAVNPGTVGTSGTAVNPGTVGTSATIVNPSTVGTSATIVNPGTVGTSATIVTTGTANRAEGVAPAGAAALADTDGPREPGRGGTSGVAAHEAAPPGPGAGPGRSAVPGGELLAEGSST